MGKIAKTAGTDGEKLEKFSRRNAEARKHVDAIAPILRGGKIQTAEASQAVGEYRKMFNEHLKALEVDRKEIAGKVYKAWQEVNSIFTDAAAPFKEAVQLADKLLREWASEQQRQLAEARRLAEIAARAAFVEQTPQAQATATEALAVFSEATENQKVKVEGLRQRTIWRAEVYDAPALLRAAAENPAAFGQYVTIAQNMLDRAAGLCKTEGNHPTIPGVRVVKDVGFAS